MTRKSNTENVVLKAADEKQLELFRIRMGELGFKVVEILKKVADIVENELKAPPRASVENVAQLTYVCKLPNKYDVYILSGVLEGELTSSGYPWVHIRDEKEELVVSWRFSKNNVSDLLKRISAYAHYAKGIASSRYGDSNLVQVNFFEYQWVSKSGKLNKEVSFHGALAVLDQGEKKIVSKGEKARSRYFESTEGTDVKRFKDTTTTW